MLCPRTKRTSTQESFRCASGVATGGLAQAAEGGVGNRPRLRRPIGAGKPSLRTPEVSGPREVESRFGLSFFAGKLSDVRERYLAGAHHIREALHEAKDAVARVKAAVRSQPSSGTAKTSKEPTKKERRLSATGRKAIQDAARRRSAQ